VAEERVLAALERRLQRALERELRHLSLEELHFDLRSWQESLSRGEGCCWVEAQVVSLPG
jgi:hypothetical protein